MADYPISNIPRRIVYTGSAGVGPYAFPFEVLLETDINVYKNDILLALTADYTVTISPTLGTGEVTLVVAATGTDRITIVGARAVERTTDFTTGGDFFANTVNSELDSQTILTQQVAETAERSIKAPVTDPTNINMTLPINTSRAGKTLAFDADGNPIAGDPIGNFRGDWAAGVSYQNRDIVKDTTNDNIYLAIVPHTSSGSLPIDTNVDVAKWALVIDAEAAGIARIGAEAAEAAALVSANNAASSASAASTSATNAATSASTATTQATNASNSASAASTSATNASNSATAAATSATNAASSASAAATSATNAANSASSASSSASTATTQATNASNSASSASTSATTATTQAGIATTQATNAASSASAAAASATNAANSATNAATSATNASNSATSAAGSAAVAESIAESLVLEFNPLTKPTIDLDFANNDYTIYDSFANSYTDKPYADMLTVTNGVATGFDAIGLLRNSVANNIRLVFDPETGVSQGALVEPAATNLLLRSEEFQTTWSIVGTASIGTNTVVAPDGTLTADKFVLGDTITSGNAAVFQSATKPATSAPYTSSVYIKAGGFNSLRLILRNAAIASNFVQAYFNAATGVIAQAASAGGTFTSASATITPVGNGWYRCSVTGTTSTETSLNVRLFSYQDGTGIATGDGTSGLFIWGAQLETGSVPTSYIKTEASTVTRVADQITRTLGNEFNPFEGTLFAEGVFSENREQVFLSLSDGTLDNRVQVGLSSTGRPVGFINTAGVTEFNQDLDLGDLRNTTVKVALSYKNNSAFIVANGVASAIDASVALPTVTNMRVGSIDATTSVYNGTISTAQYYPKALSEAECIALTTLGA
jgi:hypothetical protein